MLIDYLIILFMLVPLKAKRLEINAWILYKIMSSNDVMVLPYPIQPSSVDDVINRQLECQARMLGSLQKYALSPKKLIKHKK
jgi:hypothetical protein